jgi:hypothetical protein
MIILFYVHPIIPPNICTCPNPGLGFPKYDKKKNYVHPTTLPHFCACPKLGPGFLMLYVMVLFVFNDLR